MIARNDVLSIYGLYLFQTDLFDDFICPTGLDRDLVIDSIVMENAEMELLYPDADFMKGMIKLWSRKEQVVWQKLVETMNLEYNPIWNKDGTIHYRTDIHGEGRTDVNGDTTNKVSAYNDDDFHNRSNDHNEGYTTGNNDGWEEHTKTEQGNIGVTSSQQLIREELEIRKINIIDFIVKSFRQRFCLLVY